MSAHRPPVLPLLLPPERTPEQQALIQLFDRMAEFEAMAKVERQVQRAFETEVMERLEALSLRLKALEDKR